MEREAAAPSLRFYFRRLGKKEENHEERKILFGNGKPEEGEKKTFNNTITEFSHVMSIEMQSNKIKFSSGLFPFPFSFLWQLFSNNKIYLQHIFFSSLTIEIIFFCDNLPARLHASIASIASIAMCDVDEREIVTRCR